MSKTLNMLNSAESQRSKDFTPKPKKLTRQVSTANSTWIIAAVVTVLLLSNFSLTLKLFTMMKDYSADKNNSSEKLGRVEELVSDNGRKIRQMGDDVQAMSIKTKDIYSKVDSIQETMDSQAQAIENLTKAKNTLFKRVSALEAQLSQLGGTK